jgi:NAD+ diphosphatase
VTAPIERFKHCPACGAPLSAPGAGATVQCGACHFLYHFNPTVAVGGLLVRPDERLLFVRRAKDPSKGRLALPGGFVDMGETAEESLRREILEEVGLEVGKLVYLCSRVNGYFYGGITYPVLDFFFVSHVGSNVEPAALEDVASLHWIDPREMDLEEIAFPSVRSAVLEYRALLTAQ